MLQRTASTASPAGIPRRAILLWATVISLALGAIEFLGPFDDGLRIARNALHRHAATGRIAVVAIDDRSLDQLGEWPWRLDHYSQLLDALGKSGARTVVFDGNMPSAATPGEQDRFRAAVRRFSGEVALTFPAQRNVPSTDGMMPRIARQSNVRMVSVDDYYNYGNVIWRVNHYRVDAPRFQSAAGFIARRQGSDSGEFRIDYSVRLDTLPVVSAVDLLTGRSGSANLAGKSVVVGVTVAQWSQRFAVPTEGRVPAVLVHALAADTLMAGRPIDIGWLAPIALALAAASLQLFARQRWIGALAACGAAVALLAGPIWLERHLVSVDVMPSLALLAIAIGSGSWYQFRRSYRVRGMSNMITGLPNLTALRDDVRDTKATLIAARVQNFAEITAALPADSEKALVRQIVARLALGTRGQKIYQGDDGVFVWLAVDDDTALDDQLEALHALCRTPVSVAGANVDLVVSFGVDGGLERSIANRVGGALVAADEAAAEGHHWKRFDPAKLKDAAWKLSLLGRLDTAIDSGEIWVAYQPKFDLKDRRIVGAEALVRWSHAEKGEIGPADFIPAAEQHNRIDKLTAHVLEDGVRTASEMRRADRDFEVAVNLSARLLDRPDLVDRVHALLVKYDLPSRCLTLEVTESAAMTGHERSLETLEALRGLGVNISIDDYGTGFSTLDYLKRIPANEIKIDRSFVKMIDRSQSDRLLVESTIHLAHSLGRAVVAEGVETMEVLRALETMGCDKAQGFLLGKPMPVRQLGRLIFADRRKTAA